MSTGKELAKTDEVKPMEMETPKLIFHNNTPNGEYQKSVKAGMDGEGNIEVVVLEGKKVVKGKTETTIFKKTVHKH